MIRLRAVLALTAVGLVAVGCEEGTRPPQGAETRSYSMGWAPNPPRFDPDLFFQVVDSVATVSEAVIVQQPVPWPELFAGASMDSLVEDRGGLVDYLRLQGLDEVVFLVDPLDGLDRRMEDPGLVEAGRSILEPEIRTIHETWVREIAERTRAEWFGLASEINTLGTLGDPDLYAELVDLVNDLAPEVRALSPGTRVFVSFQADEALGHVPGVPSQDELETIDDFDIDALGLSSYPVFFFETPAAMPRDYFGAFRDVTNLPLIMVEGGWSSESVPGLAATPQEQVEFFRRFEGFLDAVNARLWVMLTFADLDIPALGLPPDRAETLSNFAFMGIVDTAMQRKPAFTEWVRIFERPLAR